MRRTGSPISRRSYGNQNVFFRGCDHKMKTSIAKRNFPSCSLHSQFTASQKLPLLFPNAKQMETIKWNQHRKKKLPLLLTSFTIHCLTKASAFVPQCKNIWNQQMGTSNWKPTSQKGNIWLYSYETIQWKPASQKETSPLAHFVRNSLPHKSFRFCSPMQYK